MQMEETNNYIVSYNTSQLIDRAYSKLKSINSNTEKKAFCKPEIKNLNRKSYIVNFIKFCSSINRNPEEVRVFIDRDMNAETSFIAENNIEDGNSALKFNNIYKNTIIMTTITNYMKEYVLCNLCKSGNTDIKKKDRITYLVCNSCKSSRAIN
jgi:translation initiation factor 2 subunit 2